MRRAPPLGLEPRPICAVLPTGISASAAIRFCMVEPPRAPDTDFCYRIFNADGGEVEQCGNGARCFVRFVREQGLTDKTRNPRRHASRA